MKQKTRVLTTALSILLSVISLTNLYGQNLSKHKIIARGDCTYPPFEFINENGEPDGFNVDLFKALMAELNMEYELQLIHWTDAINLLKEKKIDVILGMASLDSRAKTFIFSSPHSYLYLNIVCHKSSDINSMDDLKNKEVILQNQKIAHDVISQLNVTDRIITVDNMYDGLLLLSKGKHDAAVCSDILARRIISSSDFKNLEIRHLPTMDPINYCLALHPNNQELKTLFNTGFAKLKANGTYNQIYNKWFSVYQKPIVSQYIYIVIITLAIIVLIAFIIIYIMKKHIHNVIYKLNELNGELTENLLKTQLAIKTSKLKQWDYDCETGLFKTVNDTLLAGNSFTMDDYYKSTHPNDTAKLETILKEMKEGKDCVYSFDIRMKHPEKQEWQYMSIDGTSVKDKTGKIIKYTGFMSNNTKFVKLNQRLKERNLHLGMALQAGYIIPAVLDVETDMIHISSAQISKKNGSVNMDSSPIPLKDLISNIHPDDRGHIVKMFDDLKAGIIKKGHNEICYNLSGEYDGNFEVNYMGISFDKNGKPGKIVGYFQNITKRKKAEMQLKKQKEFMSNILDLIPVPIYIKDVENGGKYVYWNNEAEKMFGDGLSKSTIDMVEERSAKEIIEVDKNVFNTGIPYNNQEIIKAIDGKEYETVVHKNLIYNEDRKLLLATRWDVGYQNELFRKFKILSVSLSALKAFTWYCDLRDGILKFGDGLEHTGASPTLMNSLLKFAQKIHPRHRQKFLDFMDNFCKQESGDFTIEYEVDFSGDGNYQWWECRGVIEVEKKDNMSYKYIYGMDINIDNLKKNELALLKTKTELDNLNQQNELILNNTNSGLVFLDNNYVVQWENLTSFLPNHPMTQNYKKGNICYKAVRGLDIPCNNCVVEKSRISLKRELKKVELNGFTAELTATPVFDKNNQKIGTVLKIVDITERNKINLELETAKNKAEEANLLMLNIFDRLPCMLFIKDVDNDFRYIIANNYFCDMLGKPHNEVIGKTDFELFGKDEAEKFRSDDIIAVNEISPFIFEEETWWQGKHTVWQTTKALIDAINGHQIMIALSLDLTEKIDAYNQLQEAKEKAEQSNKLKSAFLANMSHEIRTPLNAIVGFSELMLYNQNEEDKKEYSRIIRTNNELLLRLIGDILDLSKIEAGMIALRPKKFNVSELFNNLFSSLNQSITNKDVELICEIPYKNCMVELDKNRFTQVVTNFATNAIKFTPKGEIKMGYEYIDTGIRIYVSDTGIGIAPDKIHKVFERFEKLDDFAQGTGLGMAICKAILDSSNGRIGLESKVGEGSTFWAWFPVEAIIEE